MAITIRDVAKEAGVSVTTVSKVLNRSPQISEETTARVRATMERLHYTPNARAQSFARRSTKTVAFITAADRDSAFLNPHTFEIMLGLQLALQRKGYALQFIGVRNNDLSEVEHLIGRKSFDALVLHASVVTKRLANVLLSEKHPHLVIGHPDFATELCWIDTNNPLSGQVAASHLLKIGRRRIAFIGGLRTDAISEARLGGITEILSRSRLTIPEELLLRGESTRKDGFSMAEQLLTASPRPDAIICANNHLAVGCMQALQLNAIQVPREIAVITFDDFPFSRITDPPLSVVSIDVFDLGQHAAKLILDKIRHPDLQVQSFVTLPILMERESTVSPLGL